MKPYILLGIALLAPGLTGRAESMIDAGAYPDDAAAAKAWVARAGSPAATMREAGGRRALSFACPFATSSTLGRGCWDLAAKLDLAQAEGVQLEIFCADAGPISSFSLYFQTGDGWRSMPFAPRRSNAWETITLRKSDAHAEGRPGGWAAVTTVRLAAWKGDNADTTFQVRELRRIGVAGEDARILVVPNHADAEDSHAEEMSRMLGNLGLRHALMAEAALKPVLLAKTDLVILPHNPKLSEDAAAALETFAKRGGRLLVCYIMPPALQELAGLKSMKHTQPATKGQFSFIEADANAFASAPKKTAQASWNINAVEVVPDHARTLAHWCDAEGRDTGFPAVTASKSIVYLSHVLLRDDRENKERLLLAMAGLLRPDCWREIIAAHRAEMDRLAEHESYTVAHAALLRQTKAGSEARARLEQASRLREEADAATREGRFATALDTTDLATRRLREAFCLAQEPKAGEFRAMWCHSAFGVKGLSWDEAIQRLKDNGFTAIMPNMLWGGSTFYPSAVLPQAASAVEQGDQMAACLAACKKHGIQCHVWKVNWNPGHTASPAFLEKMRTEGRLQRNSDGVEAPWLCPSNPANLVMERESLLELAGNYAIDGIHFDYIRYPDSDHCFCAPCRERFEKATAKPVAKWPADVLHKGARREEWITWCQGNISELVRTTSEQVRKVRPGIKVSAAVFSDWEVDSRTVMQDWKLWCEKGWLDFVCPMDYTMNHRAYEAKVRRQKVLAGPAGLVPGIGASSSNSRMEADAVIHQIHITRQHDTKGFIIFNYGEREARDMIPLLGLGATRAK
ncbi:MAG: family 10 glycosylhydrolase [Verrucomicrobiales bacterium]|nr:family 10 glycosylhydrolase [Verrucomicrobiales bacterium]